MSEVASSFFSPIEFTEEPEVALLEFYGCSSIPNIDKSNNTFTLINTNNELLENNIQIKVPEGTYKLGYISKYLEKRLQSFENDYQVDAVITDFKKAFVTIDNRLLVSKLETLGNDDPLLSWLKSYFASRKQYVFVNGARSNIIEVPSDVPQG
ncbi:uncharacterized protein LOC126896078 [Daktulosphaira vitifoliae]|uniref:uncharacterized protein LOC126896078 n=1 Tax=Daktulosphaira vitifoliae TaxID=58002 RepID=UPI0021AAFFA4|nr:uncharacterized protein LOC126896078 [Daktulosphaira vitifoliae]